MPQRTTPDFEFDDTAFLSALNHNLAEFRVETKADLMRTGIEVRNAAVRYAPIAKEHGGTLRASIQVEDGTDAEGYFVDVGTSIGYAIYQEYGTSKMRRQPFMRPAIAEVLKVTV